MKRIIKYFLQGLLYTVPLAVTIYVTYAVFVMIDDLIPIAIPGLGALLLFGIITAIGVIANHLVSDRIILSLEKWMRKAPLINLIYTSVRDLMMAFVGEKKGFNKPVVVKLYEQSEIRRLGFITNDNFQDLGKGNDLITVYMPHSYNISGNVYLVPKSYVEPLDVNSTDLMKYTMSGGVTSVFRKLEHETIPSTGEEKEAFGGRKKDE